jgi:hypothetical protein
LNQKNLEKYVLIALDISGISIAMLLILAWVLKFTITKPIYFGKILFVVLGFCSFLIGIWFVLGSIYRWKSFTKAPKRGINLDSVFGGFANVLYVVFGVCMLLLSAFSLYIINTKM